MLIESALLVSLAANVYFVVQSKRRTTGEKKDLEEYLSLKKDLSNMGGGIMEIRRIDPSDIFYRSVR